MIKAARPLLTATIVACLTLTLGSAAPAMAVPADDPTLGAILPPSLHRHIPFAPITRTYTNPEGGTVRHTLRNSGLDNSSALFSTDRNGGVTIDVNNRISPSYKVAYYFAGVEFGCAVGVGDPLVEVLVSPNTTIKVNRSAAVTARTELLTEFIQQSAKTAIDVGVASAACGSSEGAACPAAAAAAVDNVVQQSITTWNLQDMLGTSSSTNAGWNSSPGIVPVYKQKFQPGRLTVVPFFLLRYSPGMNRIRIANLGIHARGCAGPAQLRPFIRTIGRTKSGNYVDYTSYGGEYPFYPNKVLPLDS